MKPIKIASALLIGLCLLLPLGAKADQTSGCFPTSSLPGLTLVNTLNAWIKSVTTSYSGSSAPATDCGLATLKGQLWLDTSVTPNRWRINDGASNNLVIAWLDAVNHVYTPPVGGGTNTIASATTTDLWSVVQSAVTVSGTTTITALASSSATPGTLKIVKFSGILTLTNNGTSLILPTGANITTAAGDYALVLALTSTNVAVVSYTRANGNALASLAVVNVYFQSFVASGTYTPHAGLIKADVTCVGPGGGGGGTALNSSTNSSPGGGGAGAWSRVLLTAAAIGGSQTVTVGTGGAGGTAGANSGSNGSGATSVGSLCTAGAGAGATGTNAGATSAGGLGGSAGTGDIAVTGNRGQAGSVGGSIATVVGGGAKGADSPFGAGGVGTVNTTGGAAAGCGAGGGATSSNTGSNQAGGAGTNGCVYIWEYASQ